MQGSLGGVILTISLAAAAAAILPSVGHADPGFLGLEVQGLDGRAAAALGPDHAKGVLVKDVAVGEAGAIAGFRRGDLIIEFAGSKIAGFDDLLKHVVKTKAGQHVPIVVLRGGKRTGLALHTTAKPAAWSVTNAVFQNYSDLGLTVAAIGEEARKKFALPWGTVGLLVTVVDDKGRAAASLRPGEVIVSVNLRDVWEPRHLTSQIDEARKAGRDDLLLLVRGSGGYRYALLPVK